MNNTFATMKHLIITAIIVVLHIAHVLAQPTFEHLYAPFLQQGARTVIQTSDGGYAIAGGGLHESYMNAAYLLKLDSNGTTLWDRTYLYWAPGDGMDVAEAPNGDLLFLSEHAEVHYIDIKVQRFSSAGTLLWDTLIYFIHDTMPGVNDHGRGMSLTVGHNGQILVTGAAHSEGMHRPYIVALSNTGELEWRKLFHPEDYGTVYRTVPSPDGNYVLCIQAGEYTSKVHAVKMDPQGEVLWTRTLDSSIVSIGNSMAFLPNGNHVQFVTRLADTTYYPEIIEFTPEGDVAASVLLTDLPTTVSGSIEAVGDSMFMILCRGQSAIEVHLVDMSGHIMDSKTYGETYNTDPYDGLRVGYSLKYLGNLHFIFTGRVFDQIGKIYVVCDRFGADTVSSVLDMDRMEFGLFPNPATDNISIASASELPTDGMISIFTISGERVLHQAFARVLDISALSSGTYILELRTNGMLERRRFIKT